MNRAMLGHRPACSSSRADLMSHEFCEILSAGACASRSATLMSGRCCNACTQICALAAVQADCGKIPAWRQEVRVAPGVGRRPRQGVVLMPRLTLCVFALSALPAAPQEKSAIDLDRARRFFQEVR